MAFAPSDANSLTYAFGTVDGQLLITTDGGAHWGNLNASGGVPGRGISLAWRFIRTNANILYATLSGFNEEHPATLATFSSPANALAPSPTMDQHQPSGGFAQ